MSLRDQILEALTEHPEGLTSKELAPMCQSSEDDAAMVGRVIAGLRAENVIHAGAELREGQAIWISGPGKKTAPPEPKYTLPYRPDAKPAPAVSEAARAIAAMRADKSAPVRRPAQPAPQPRAADPSQEYSAMKTIREKIEAALKTHGPMDSRTMRKRGLKHDALAQNLRDLAEKGVLKRLGGGPRSSIYGLPGQKLGDATPPPKAEPRAPQTPKAPKPKKVKKARNSSAPKKAARRDPPPALPVNGEPAFAINEAGELGIEVDGQKVRLDAGAFERLRSFIERTKPVWNGGA